MTLPLEQQVCSLDLAKRLKELGVKQEGYQAWVEDRPTHSFHLWNADLRAMRYMSPRAHDRRRRPDEEYSAFSVAELGEMLPDEMFDQHEDLAYALMCSKVDSAAKYWTVYYWEDDRGELGRVEAPTEADARAKMLVYLLENKLVTV